MNTMAKVALLLGALIAPAIASAQDYPARPVTVVIPFPPGGTNDLIGRYTTDALTKLWGKQVLVENRGGAGTAIGAGYVAKAKPDGYTVMFVSSSFTTNAATQPNLPFDPVKDLQPVAMAAYGERFIIAGTRVPLASLQDIQREAKARKLFYGTSGAGGIGHLTGELMNDILGVEMEAVHYQGGAAAMTDLGGGRLDFYTGGIGDVQGGIGKIITAFGNKRSATMPDVPSAGEAGFPTLAAPTWWGVFAPASTPKAVTDKLHKDIVAVMSTPEAVAFLKKQGAEPSNLSTEDFAKHVKDEIDKWKGLIKKRNISTK
jgi:tripartite-type tricarboxylate transporter receptor subunit TctC